MAHVSGQDVADFLGQGTNTTLVALAGEHVVIVTAMVKAYTRDNGFDEGMPGDDLAAVITTATARLVANPQQLDAARRGGDAAAHDGKSRQHQPRCGQARPGPRAVLRVRALRRARRRLRRGRRAPAQQLGAEAALALRIGIPVRLTLTPIGTGERWGPQWAGPATDCPARTGSPGGRP